MCKSPYSLEHVTQPTISTSHLDAEVSEGAWRCHVVLVLLRIVDGLCGARCEPSVCKMWCDYGFIACIPLFYSCYLEGSDRQGDEMRWDTLRSHLSQSYNLRWWYRSLDRYRQITIHDKNNNSIIYSIIARFVLWTMLVIRYDLYGNQRSIRLTGRIIAALESDQKSAFNPRPWQWRRELHGRI